MTSVIDGGRGGEDQSSHVAEAQKPEFQNVIYKVATLLVPSISTAGREET